jgi:hypothetical protein
MEERNCPNIHHTQQVHNGMEVKPGLVAQARTKIVMPSQHLAIFSKPGKDGGMGWPLSHIRTPIQRPRRRLVDHGVHAPSIPDCGFSSVQAV